MSFIGKAIGKITGAADAAKGQQQAAAAQAGAAEAGIEEQRRQFDQMIELMKPFIEPGSEAIGKQAVLAGVGTPEQEAAAIESIKRSPEFLQLIQQGEEAILANASATGGLRGGNTQAALAQFRPQVLSSLISERFNRLGNLAQLGQASAAGQATAGLNTASNIGQLLAQRGAAQAGGAIAQNNRARAGFNDALSIASVAAKF